MSGRGATLWLYRVCGVPMKLDLVMCFGLPLMLAVVGVFWLRHV